MFLCWAVKGRESSKQDPDIARGISLFCEEMPATVSVDKLLKVSARSKQGQTHVLIQHIQQYSRTNTHCLALVPVI